MIEKILCAAIKIDLDDDYPIIIGGFRHSDCIRNYIKLGGVYVNNDQQGF